MSPGLAALCPISHADYKRAGGVGGTSHHSINSAPLSNQTPSSLTIDVSLSPNSSSSAISPVPTPSMATASSLPTQTAKLNTTMLNTTNLASVIWNSRGVTDIRVWYHTEDNMIREIGRNDTGNEWYNSRQSHGPAKRDTPIAASCTGPPDWLFVGALTH